MNQSLLATHLKATARQLVPLYVVLILAMGLLYWFNGHKLTDLQNILYFSVLFLVLASLVLMPQLVVMIRMYQCLYGDYAYLTQILPLSTGKLVRSFVGLSMVWNAISLPLILIFGMISLQLNPVALVLEFDGKYEPTSCLQLVTDGFALWQKNPVILTVILAAFLIYALLWLIANGLVQLAWITLAQRIFSTRRIFLGLVVIAVVIQLVSLPLVYGFNSLFSPALVLHMLPGQILSIDLWMTDSYNVLTAGADYLAAHPTAVFLQGWSHLIFLFVEIGLAYLIAYRCLAKRPSLN